MRCDVHPPAGSELPMGLTGGAGIALTDLLSSAGFELGAAGAGSVAVTGLTHDSTRVRPGMLFVAVQGTRVDGAVHAATAVAAGAVAVVAASEDRGVGVPWIRVADDRAALADLSAAFFGQPSHALRVVGVTGTNGKSTTTSMIGAILEASALPSGTIGTVEARWAGHSRVSARTTPEAPELQELLHEMRLAGCTHAALEVSSHAIDLARVRALRLAVVAFTNLTQDHLDWHGTLDAYGASKERLFTELAPAAPAVICIDDAHGLAFAERLRAGGGREVVTCGFEPTADLRVALFAPAPDGAQLRLCGSVAGLSVDVTMQLRSFGRHDARNAVVAAAAALLAGATPEGVAAGLASHVGVPGRLELVVADAGADDGVRVYVDYAHTPHALETVLAAARETCSGRLLCVFGCGGDRDRSKRAPMGRAVGQLADIAILTSDNPRSEDPQAIVVDVLVGLEGASARVEVDVDRRRAIARALDLAQAGDVVLVAGKGHEAMQEVAGRRHDFDDRQVVRDVRRARRKS